MLKMSSPSTPLRPIQTSSISAPQKATTGNARKRNNDGSPQTTPTRTQDQSTAKKATKKHKREPTKCACGNLKCKELMNRLLKLNKTDRGYFNIAPYLAIPKPPLNNTNRQTKLRKEEIVTRLDQDKKHNCICDALGPAAKERVEDFYFPEKNPESELYKEKMKAPVFACIHLHPEILKLSAAKCKGSLPKFIPRSFGNRLSNEGTCQFREKDVVPSSAEKDYFQLPNYPVDRAIEDFDKVLKELEHKKLAEKLLK